MIYLADRAGLWHRALDAKARGDAHQANVRCRVRKNAGLAHLRALGFRVRKPERRAIERDEEAVQWKQHTWAAFKCMPSGKAD